MRQRIFASTTRFSTQRRRISRRCQGRRLKDSEKNQFLSWRKRDSRRVVDKWRVILVARAASNLARLAYLKARFRANWYFSVNSRQNRSSCEEWWDRLCKFLESFSRETREGIENNRESLWLMWCFIDSEIDEIVLNSRVRHLIEMWRRSKTKDLLQPRHVRRVFVVGIERWL